MSKSISELAKVVYAELDNKTVGDVEFEEVMLRHGKSLTYKVRGEESPLTRDEYIIRMLLVDILPIVTVIIIGIVIFIIEIKKIC